jgi:YHS domain-containing protein
MFHENERDAKEWEEVTKYTYAGNNYYFGNPNNECFEFYK